MDGRRDQKIPIPMAGREVTSVVASPWTDEFAMITSRVHEGAALFIYQPEKQGLRLLMGRPASAFKRRAQIVCPVRFKSLDGAKIPAILYRPLKAGALLTGYAVIWLHGGPNQQHKPMANRLLELLSGAGCAVLGINYRGSTGFGNEFSRSDEPDVPLVQVHDCVAAKNFLVRAGIASDKAILIAGHSYGAFLTLLTMAAKPGSFPFGIGISGVTDWECLLANIPAWASEVKDLLLRKLGNRCPTRLRQLSPIHLASRIKAPLLIVHGDRDLVVPKEQSDMLVRRMQELGANPEYLVCRGEGHTFRSDEAISLLCTTVLAFIWRHIPERRRQRTNKLVR